jgi:hypothetical protein
MRWRSMPRAGKIAEHMRRSRRAFGGAFCVDAAVLAVLSIGCAPPPEGLAATEDGDGPRVVFDFDKRPLPEIPFPNDIATRPDDTSPTGLRINASMLAPTNLESTARERFDQLSGWGVFQPIALRFDRPLDLQPIFDRHRDWVGGGDDYDFTNDAVYVFDVTPGSPTYLEPVALDFGDGNFPILLRTPHQYWEHDPKTITKALAYETFNEDVDGDGRLEPGEDLDLDGVLDIPNVHPANDGDPRYDIDSDLMSFYERETNSLIFKPVIPLRERTRYAVVITKRLEGPGGRPVRSPFDWVNHTAQTDELLPVLDALDPFGLDEDDIAFAWTFTTQDASGDMVTLRNGLYGEGPLSWLREDNPPRLTSLLPMLDPVHPDTGEARPNVYTLTSEELAPVIGPLASAAFGGFGVTNTDKLVLNHTYYGYHVSGTFQSPRLIDLVDEGTLDARAWPPLASADLRERVVYDEIQFWCAIPKKEYLEDPTRPAPVVLYAHGYTSNKIEQLGLALHAKFGIAGCSLDAPYHGVQIADPMQETLARALLGGLGLGPTADALLKGRIRDVDGDGDADVGGEMFSGYMFRTKDNLRQTLLDWLTLVRLLRTFGTTTMLDVNGDGKDELLGDFDADGIVDLGGPDVDFFASGTSLGGLVSSMLSAIEPQVVAAAPISGGAGLVDLTIRSEQGGVVEAVVLRMLGPLLIGEPASDGRTRIYTLFANGNVDTRYDLAVTAEIQPGDVIMATNLETGAARCARVMPDEPPRGYETYVGWNEPSNCALNDSGFCRTCAEGTEGTYACDLARTFRVGVPADVGDELRIDVFSGPDPVDIVSEERDCVAKDGQEPRATIDRFEYPIQYRGLDVQPGDPIIALEDGYGFQRGTPIMRRFTQLAQMAIEGADPAIFAVHYSRDPLRFAEDGATFTKRPTHVLNVTTIGDPNVPVNTGVNIAKVGGFVEIFRADGRWAKTPNRVLIEEGVVEGIPWRQSGGVEWGPVLVDVDNISGSTNVTPRAPDGSVDGLLAPRLDPPLRLVVPTIGAADGGVSGLVLPMLDATDGQHGFPPPGLTDADFDVGQFMEHQIGWYFHTRGREVRFDACMETVSDCDFIPEPPAAP